MPKRLLKNSLVRAGISLGICLLAGYIGSIYAIPAIRSWGSSLNKPDLIPPNSLIIPIGIILYILLGLALFCIWQADLSKKDTMTCFQLFIFGLVLNVLWVYVFFGLMSPFFGFIIMVMLLAILCSTILQSLRVSIAATFLLTPYLIVSIIVAYLDFMIYIMNPNLPVLVI
ncbi:MAG: tryptophan-rich sensory protein [Methanoregulaceae archaeon]|jgi:tryptophan-rich sensory protein